MYRYVLFRQSRLDDEDASLSSPKAADGKQHTLKGFAQNRSMAVLERVLLRLETAKAPALLPVRYERFQSSQL